MCQYSKPWPQLFEKESVTLYSRRLRGQYYSAMSHRLLQLFHQFDCWLVLVLVASAPINDHWNEPAIRNRSQRGRRIGHVSRRWKIYRRMRIRRRRRKRRVIYFFKFSGEKRRGRRGAPGRTFTPSPQTCQGDFRVFHPFNHPVLSSSPLVPYSSILPFFSHVVPQC